MHYFIHGFYGAGNAGDDAILHALIERLRSLAPDAEITVCVRSLNLPAYFGTGTIRTVSGFDLPAVKRAVAASDLVLVGGGGLFQDYNGFDGLNLFHTQSSPGRQPGAIPYYSAPIFLAKTLGKPVLLYGLGVGPFVSAEGRLAAGWIASLADAVTVRDHASWELLHGAGAKQTVLAADPVVSLGKLLGSPPPRLGADEPPRVMLNLRRWAYDPQGGRDCWELLIAAANHLLHKHGAQLFMLTYNRSALEEQLAEQFAAQFAPDKVKIIPYRGSTPLEQLELLGASELTLAMRLHASIMSMAAGTPAIGLSYDPKVQQFFEEAGLPELAVPMGEAQQYAAGPLLEMIDNMLLNREYWRERVGKAMNSMQQREQLNMQMLRTHTERADKQRGESAR